jgi:hypothetical protein
MRHPQQRRERDADESTLFVRVNGVVLAGEGAPYGGECQKSVEWQLGQRGPDLDPGHKWRTHRPKDAQARHRHVFAEGIGDEIDLMP